MTTNLEELEGLASEAGVTAVAESARDLRARLSGGRFHVAVLGQFKRGKSTLVNALVGEPILPVGVVPVTSVVTLVRYGPRAARVKTARGGWQEIRPEELGLWVSEEHNPENHKGVSGVEALVPSPLLAHGLCLVDTPGLGSVQAGNDAETRAFVPHVDVALLVSGIDPPINADELAILGSLPLDVEHIVVLLNKADRASPEEIEEAREFTRVVLRERLARPFELLVIAARAEREAGASRFEWADLVTRLDALARDAGADLVATAMRRGVRELAGRLERELRAMRLAFVTPVADLVTRQAALERGIGAARRTLGGLGYRFDAARDALRVEMASDREAFVARVEGELIAAVRSTTSALPTQADLRQRALEVAHTLTARAVSDWLTQERPRIADRFARLVDRLVEDANRFLDGLVAAGVPPDAMPEPLVPDPTLDPRTTYYFYRGVEGGSVRLGARLADRLRTAPARRRAALRAATSLAARLLDVNTRRVIGDLDERVIETRRRIEAALRARLDDVVRIGRDAIAMATARRAEGESAIRAAVEEVDRWLARVANGS